MAITDWVLTALFLIAMIGGWRMGTISVLGKIGSCILGYLAARAYSSRVTAAVLKLLPELHIENSNNNQVSIFLSLFFTDSGGFVFKLLNIIAFILIFILVRRLILWLAFLTSDFFSRGALAQINHAGGSLLSVILLFLVILICADIFFPVLTQLQITESPEKFLYNSQIIMPLIRYIQYLI